MKHSRRLQRTFSVQRESLLLGVISLVALAGCSDSRTDEKDQPSEVVALEATSQKEPWRPAAQQIDPKALSAYEDVVQRWQEGVCGPYPVLMAEGTEEWAASCAFVALLHAPAFTARFGLQVPGKAEETILLFATHSQLRRFSEGHGRLSAGYFAFADAFNGLVALSTESVDKQQFERTLAHELTHLVSYRCFPEQPSAWLAEGMANDLGQALSGGGFGLRAGGGFGSVGLSRDVDRVIGALRARAPDEPAARLEDLLAKAWSQFDSEANSHDYEMSSLLVRFLGDDPVLGSKFRAYLKQLSLAGESPPELLPSLGLSNEELETRFRVHWGLAP